MKKNDPLYQDQLDDAVARLMEDFLAWNVIQGEQRDKGYVHNHYDEEELAKERLVFRAIAERLLLEDVPFEDWKWFETPWAGTDGNTGMEARIVDFLVADTEETVSGIIGFYVARNRRFWYAIPLAEIAGEENLLDVYEVNCVQDALNAWKLSRPAGEW